jgi:hypothetical protein
METKTPAKKYPIIHNTPKDPKAKPPREEFLRPLLHLRSGKP